MSQIKNVTLGEVSAAAAFLARSIQKLTTVYGIPRGGVSAALALAACSRLVRVTEDPAEADWILDDLIDTGDTMARYIDQYPGKTFAALFDKGNHSIRRRAPLLFGSTKDKESWLVFPWEASEVGSAGDIVTRFLSYIGEDPNREGLLETPARVLKAWGEWFGGYGKTPSEVVKAFTDGANGVDEMVLVRDIPVYSHCEHHLAPFFGVAHVAYIPDGKIVGLSKLPRLVDVFAQRLQVQERLTNQIADALQEVVNPKGIGVVLECRHLCMESRGIRRVGTSTVTSAMRGAMMTQPAARSELLSLVRR